MENQRKKTGLHRRGKVTWTFRFHWTVGGDPDDNVPGLKVEDSDEDSIFDSASFSSNEEDEVPWWLTPTEYTVARAGLAQLTAEEDTLFEPYMLNMSFLSKHMIRDGFTGSNAKVKAQMLMPMGVTCRSWHCVACGKLGRMRWMGWYPCRYCEAQKEKEREANANANSYLNSIKIENTNADWNGDDNKNRNDGGDDDMLDALDNPLHYPLVIEPNSVRDKLRQVPLFAPVVRLPKTPLNTTGVTRKVTRVTRGSPTGLRWIQYTYRDADEESDWDSGRDASGEEDEGVMEVEKAQADTETRAQNELNVQEQKQEQDRDQLAHGAPEGEYPNIRDKGKGRALPSPSRISSLQLNPESVVRGKVEEGPAPPCLVDLLFLCNRPELEGYADELFRVFQTDLDMAYEGLASKPLSESSILFLAYIINETILPNTNFLVLKSASSNTPSHPEIRHAKGKVAGEALRPIAFGA